MTAQLENTLESLLQSLLEVGICASDVQDSALESSTHTASSGYPGGLLGKKVSATLTNLESLASLQGTVRTTLIPLEVINYVDGGKNPHLVTKELMERLAGENMFTNGILTGVSDYEKLLREQLGEAFPELEQVIKREELLQVGKQEGETSGDGGEGVKMEEQA